MAKAKARRRVRDTWKEKSWYTIKTPVNFEDKEIGETPARDPDYLIGRGVEVTMRELSGDFSKQYIKLIMWQEMLQTPNLLVTKLLLIM